jgi:cytochrome c
MLLMNRLKAAPLLKFSPGTGGEGKFDQKCGNCHLKAPDANDEGPSLFGVLNRKAGTAKGYKYSPSYIEAGDKGIVWNEDNLMGFLIDQKTFLSEKLGHPAQSQMAKRFADEALRKSIVEYLMTLK